MQLKTLATQLKIPMQTLERESARAWVERRLLALESEIARLAHRYGINNTTEFLKRARSGAIDDTAESIDDFFHLDALEAERRTLRAIKKEA